MADQSLLRLILGDQLNIQHSWFKRKNAHVVYTLMEVKQETQYVLHHAQKIIAIFAAMRDFARQLKEAGHRVHYLMIDDQQNKQSIPENLNELINRFNVSRFEYQEPDEWRLDKQLNDYAEGLAIPAACVSSEHFYTERNEAGHYFFGHKHWLMENYYRYLRTQHRILMNDHLKPAGKQWNFDHDNRKPWIGEPKAPRDFRYAHDHSDLWATIVQSGVQSFGHPQAEKILWPLNREEALDQLEVFIQEVLRDFGAFQDAMHSDEPRLFHSLLSFALNTKMLSPQEVIQAVEKAWHEERVPLSSAEGFIRQILGWREYVRGVYWAKMPDYTKNNAFGFNRSLPQWFWTGKTKMRCLAHSIGQSLEEAHAHHIQRLMVIGNFALLAELDPYEVHLWYLGVYVDAYEWVEAPNTLGISQFADNGLLATKPYVSSAVYIDRMSNYCKGCYYHKKSRENERSCPFNALYWDFFNRHKNHFFGNRRVFMVYNYLKKIDDDSVKAIQHRADYLRSHLDEL